MTAARRRAAVALLFALGAASAAPVPKEVLKNFPDYYPLRPGTEWEYKVGDTPVTVKVTDFEEKDGVKTGKLVTSANGREVASETIKVDATGVYRTHINKTEIDPPVLILKFGIKDETAWETKAKINAAVVDFKFTLDGTDEIETPAGKYTAVKVSGLGDIAGTKSSVTYWFVDGVGVARLKYTIGGTDSTLDLGKFTAGEKK